MHGAFLTVGNHCRCVESDAPVSGRWGEVSGTGEPPKGMDPCLFVALVAAHKLATASLSSQLFLEGSCENTDCDDGRTEAGGS